MIKIKYQIARKLLNFLIMICIAMSISAQKDESWTTFDLDEISISIPKNLDKIYLNQKTRTKGIIVHEFSPSKRIGERGKESFYIDLLKISTRSVEEDFALRRKSYLKIFDAIKIKKIKAKDPCDLHYTITHESVNPFSNKKELLKTIYKVQSTFIIH